MTRPHVSIVVPVGGRASVEPLLETLDALELRTGDELLLVDNSRTGAVAAAARGRGVEVVRATRFASSYHARNIGAARAAGEWLLFFDADCRPLPTLLDDYFSPPAGDRAGAVAGAVTGVPDQPGLIPRYLRARGHLNQEDYLRFPYRPFAATANLLVRRAAWDEVGGFPDTIRGGGDVDLCWRLQAAGWTLEYRPNAIVEHVHREDFQELVRAWVRYGASAAWLERRYPGSYPRVAARRLPGAARCAAAATVALARGQRERAAFTALDALFEAAYTFGTLFGNDAQPLGEPSGR